MSENLQLKRYTIQRSIGEGGMADVYLAYDNVLKRLCAIKILKQQLASDAVAKIRFRREADAAAKLQHPNIVGIYDVGESENGRPFIVMEYVNGQTLKQLIAARGTIEKKEAVFLVSQVCDALVVAHNEGVVHRDIKPQNIMVKADGSVKITDFGIASVAGTIQLTQHDSVMGSVHYLAPECAKGEPASNQSDIYSLGIVLYEMLTGEVPFKGDAAVSIAMKHLQSEIKSVRSIDNSIEQSVENIIIKATAKNRAQRYQNATEMLSDLKVAFTPQHANDTKLVLESKKVSPAEKVVENETKVYTDLPTQVVKKNGQSTMSDWVEKYRKPLIYGFSGLLALLLLALIFIFTADNKSSANKVSVPDVTNLTVEKAREVLTSNGFIVVNEVEKQSSNTIEKDKVIKTSPEANKKVDKESEIKLIVSSGKELIIQDYTNKLYADIQNQFKDFTNIKVSVTYEESSQHKEGTIISQEGTAIGTVVDPNERYEIKFVVSRPALVKIPASLIGENIKVAQSELEGLGFKVNLDERDPSSLSDEEYLKIVFNTVIETNPAVNSMVKVLPDSEITISYYKEVPRVIVNKEQLYALIEQADGIDLSDKTEATKQVFEVALSNAKNILENTSATQEMVDAAVASLQKALDNLTTIEEVKYTVNFVYAIENSTAVDWSTTVAQGGYLSEVPKLPEWSGHTFEGWLLEGEIVNPFDVKIDSNKVFKAKWN